MIIGKDANRIFAGLFLGICLPSLSFGQAKDGAVLGGVAGAVIGGIVGHQNDETPEGALIGGAVGAIAGGILGKQSEQQRQIQYYQQQQAYHHYHGRPVYSTTHVHTAPVYATTVETVPVRRPVCVSDVITLVRSGVSEAVIANHIHANGIVSHPSINDVLTMHDAGVSDVIIDAMQHAPIYTTRTVYPSTRTYYSYPVPQPTYYQAVPMHRRNF